VKCVENGKHLNGNENIKGLNHMTHCVHPYANTISAVSLH